ncbi:single stranded DNA-binding domain-containing protein [Pengzhenrongella sicca]|uniref:Single-stranded DNA-binding protein n=1 Tax=Pengzhenrongella sicca TaxID=2819238 RepID=A0A8A4ZDR3_9MICO|nr:hypothetical protein [Pengzhenrongella sicca]QTE28627.1 hypothetical protein J4E96_14865 [Pengzhenrongella sicca]
MSIPTQTCVSGFIVSMGALEQTAKGVHYVRARVGAVAPAGGQIDPGQPVSKVYFDLYVYGDAAERVSRRFRKGDVFLASGRVGHVPATGTVFVAERIGHDAKRTTYRVVRTHQRRQRALHRREVDEQATPSAPGSATASIPAHAGAI